MIFSRLALIKLLIRPLCILNYSISVNFSKKRGIVKEIMSTKKAILSSVRERRMKNKNDLKSTRYPPGEIYLSVLGNGSVSSPRALYMFTDHGKYLFNCGEGTQRLSQELKMKFTKLEHVFITHNSWDNLGGLLGLSLTVYDIGLPEITIHGPPHLDLLYKHTASFVFLPELNVVTRNHEDKSYTDDVMEVKYIPIFQPDNASKLDPSEESSSESEDVEPQEPRSKRIRLSDKTGSREMTMAFACKGHSKLGQLSLEKCIAMGVPPGPLLGELKSGKDVTLPSGKVVLSKDVVSEEQVCPLFLVVECPEEYLDPFVNEEKFQCHQENSLDPSQIAALVVHFTPPEVFKSQKYQEWIKRFPDSTCHLVLNADNPSLNSIAMHQMQHKLHLLHPGMFSLLQENEAAETNGVNSGENVFQAETSTRFSLRPSTGFDRTFTLNFEPKDFTEEAMSTKGFCESLEILRNNIKQHSVSQKHGENFPEVTFLGTGSCIPCKARNVSGILVNTSKDNYVILDCGEGTHHQLVKMFGNQHKNILQNLSCIFVSHIHADHHMGLIKLLQSRKKLFLNSKLKYRKVTLVGPAKLKYWLGKYSTTFENLTSLYRFVECSSVEHGHQFDSDQQQEAVQNSDNVNLSTVAVNHCHDAWGVVLSAKSDNWKLVYSGDTTPCDGLVDVGRGCSLLIHEATMEDELVAEAINKRHSTTSEAIKVGERMEAEFTILTHFSQRYAKVPLFNENFHNRVGCAFDTMRVCSNELFILPLLIPALKCLFADDVEELHTRGHKRRQKLKLLEDYVEKVSEIKK